MLESINKKFASVRAKMYEPFAKERIEVIRYEIKDIGIDKAMKIYKKALNFAYKLKLIALLFIITMVVFDFVTLNFVDRQSIIFSIRANIKIIMIVMFWVTIYKIWERGLYCYCYKQALKDVVKNKDYKENTNISCLD